MISRRNIRVKVMQLLYGFGTGGQVATDIAKIEKSLEKEIAKTGELFIYLLHFITDVARYAETSALKRASRNLPSDADMNVNIKIAGNLLLWQLLENKGFHKAAERTHPEKLINQELVKKIYEQLTELEAYKIYIHEQGRVDEKERAIIKLIFTDLMLPNEHFISYVEEHFSNWDDDAEMMEQWVMSFMQKPKQTRFNEFISQDKWLFAKSLLSTTIEKNTLALDLIKPKLKNWDADRIAVLDMIIMRMGVCELLFFETIPTKVTINEYIDIAKEYSTEQSGHFVNGILDNIHKELQEAGKLHKVSFKK